MDQFDPLQLSELGGPRLRKVTGIIGALVGAAIGYFMAGVLQTNAILFTAGGLIAGAGLGWLFSFFVVLGGIILVAVVAMVAYFWLTGGS